MRSRGMRSESASSRSTVTWRVHAPMRASCGSMARYLSALMSTSTLGRTSLIAIMGTRLCPPAMTFASAPCRASSAQASATEAGRVYSNAGDFMHFMITEGGCTDDRVSRLHRRGGDVRCPESRRADVAGEAGPSRGAIHAGKRDRHHGANGEREALGPARPAVSHREPPGRRRDHRRRARSESRSRRLHGPRAFLLVHGDAFDVSECTL